MFLPPEANEIVPIQDFEAAPTVALFDLIRKGTAATRPGLVAVSGLGRKAVTQRVEALTARGLVRDGGLVPSIGGRPVRTLEVNPGAGYVVGVMIGSTEIDVARIDLSGGVIEAVSSTWDVELGPEATMQRVAGLLQEVGAPESGAGPWSIAVGVPGPVEFSTGRLVGPSVMPGWDGFSPRAWLRDRLDAPVWVDNHVHLMALAEWRRPPRSKRDMLFIEVGMDVGAGMMVDGRVLRGERGAAGSIGHLRATTEPLPCRCGKVGCLEALAAGWAVLDEVTRRVDASPLLAEILRARPLDLVDIGDAAQSGDALVVSVLERAAQAVGNLVADLVVFTNPGEVVLGGGVLAAGTQVEESFLKALRDAIQTRGAELITAHLSVHASSADDRGMSGAGALALDSILNPTALIHWLHAGNPLARRDQLERLAL
ncbi:ROK family protein [Pseudoclavibacter sp. RFBB5]|uniref:ROK family protein n=1 Tax=Pseudoclavibacter sp. RFBB5 TaxID=2080574 RepID=UPI0015E20826|nr:ROK family protein [Pseudoclavibacter sp. RFBB5]